MRGACVPFPEPGGPNKMMICLDDGVSSVAIFCVVRCDVLRFIHAVFGDHDRGFNPTASCANRSKRNHIFFFQEEDDVASPRVRLRSVGAKLKPTFEKCVKMMKAFFATALALFMPGTLALGRILSKKVQRPEETKPAVRLSEPITANGTVEVSTGDRLRHVMAAVEIEGELADELLLRLAEEKVAACEQRDDDDTTAMATLLGAIEREKRRAECLDGAADLGLDLKTKRGLGSRIRRAMRGGKVTKLVPPFIVASDADAAIAATPVLAIVRRLGVRVFGPSFWIRVAADHTARWLHRTGLLALATSVVLILLLVRPFLPSTPSSPTTTKRPSRKQVPPPPKQRKSLLLPAAAASSRDDDFTTDFPSTTSTVPRPSSLADIDDDDDVPPHQATRPPKHRRRQRTALKDVIRRDAILGTQRRRHQKKFPRATLVPAAKYATAVPVIMGDISSPSLCDTPLSKTRSDGDADVQSTINQVGILSKDPSLSKKKSQRRYSSSASSRS